MLGQPEVLQGTSRSHENDGTQVLTKVTARAIIIHHTGDKVNPMPAKYEIGQKIAITPLSRDSASPRDSDLQNYAGMTGEITNYYWIRPPAGDVFFLYTVRIGTEYKDIVLYEDEIERV